MPLCDTCNHHLAPSSSPLPPNSPPTAGQVQDVGLIFLSAMASAVVQQCGEAGWGEADTLATVLATLTLATAVVGVLIVGTGGCGAGVGGVEGLQL